jgi:hypothetical protein
VAIATEFKRIFIAALITPGDRYLDLETPGKIARWDDLEVEGVQLVFGLSPVGVQQVKSPFIRALSFSFGQKVSLNEAEASDTRSSYGLGRYFVTYITNTTLSHKGTVIFVEPHRNSSLPHTNPLTL